MQIIRNRRRRRYASVPVGTLRGRHRRARCPDRGGMRKFQLVLIKPSHYDDDGYVIRWWRAIIPSNSLAAVYGIAADCAERRVLGPDVEIDIDVIDETNTRVKIPELIGASRAQRQFRHGRAGRRAVEPVSARPRHRAAVARRRRAGGDGRIPRVGLPLDARRASRRARRLPGAGHRHVRRRSGGPVRRGAARCRGRHGSSRSTIS